MPLIATSAMQTALATNTEFLWGDLITFYSPQIGKQAYSGGTQRLDLPSGSIVDPSSLYYGNAGSWGLGPPIKRSKVSRKVGIEAAKVELTILAGQSDYFGGANGQYTWQQCVDFHLFDQCIVEIDRYLAGPLGWGDATYGAVVWFWGQVGEVSYGRSEIKMEVMSLLATLNQQQMPRRVFMGTCTHIFGDAMCQYDLTQMEVTLIVTTSTPGVLNFSGFVPSPGDLYVEGTIIGVTGLNTGLRRTIAFMGGGTVYLGSPFIYPISPGDTFTLQPGCDHTVARCNNLFNNLIHYGGFPYIPPPELAV